MRFVVALLVTGLLVWILVGTLTGSPRAASAHEGHADAPGDATASAGDAGPVQVSELARRNLGLQTREAELRSIEHTLTVIGEILAEPDRSATVSSRIAGRVFAIHAKEGERVRSGQRLVEVESFRVGDPPPRASYASPIEGTVTDRHVVAGDNVERNGHLFEIVDLRVLLAVGRVFEGQIGRVAIDQSVRVRVPSYPDEIFEGVVERLGGQLDPESRTLPVFVRVANPEEKLRPYMRATLSLVTERAALALVVPKSAVLGEFGNLFVFVQREDEPDLFERRAVVTGLSDDRYIEILEGVLPGERTVTAGNYSLQYLPTVAEPTEEAEPATTEHAHTDAPTSWWPWALGLAIAAISTLVVVLALRTRTRTRAAMGAH